MICAFCGKEFNNADNNCPYCKRQNLTENMSLNDAFRWIVRKYGIDIFLNETLINSMLADLAKNDEQGRKRIKLALSSGAGYQFHSIFVSVNSNFSESEIMQFTKGLIDTGFTNDFSESITSSFLYSTSIDDLTEMRYKQATREFDEIKNNSLNVGSIDSVNALILKFKKFGKYKQSEEYINACDLLLKEIAYQDAVAFSKSCKNSTDLKALLKKLNALGKYKKAEEFAVACQNAINKLNEKEKAKTVSSKETVSNVNENINSSIQSNHKKQKTISSEDEILELIRNGNLLDAEKIELKNKLKKRKNEVFDKSNIHLSDMRFSIGKIVRFGKYEWNVIALNGEYALLLARHNVRQMAFSTKAAPLVLFSPEEMWYKSAIYSWLHTSFYNDAFSEKEKEIIANADLKSQISQPGGNNSSKIFIFSKAEAFKYFKNDSERKNKHSSSWLRSFTSKDYNVAIINEDGTMYNYGYDPTTQFGVRPAIWVKNCELSELLQSKKETVQNHSSGVNTDWEIGETVSFSQYSWLVLDKYGNERLIFCINNPPIPNEKHALKRMFLNDGFINKFSAEERARICYKIREDEKLGGGKLGCKCFLLSNNELDKYKSLIRKISNYTTRPAMWVKINPKTNTI